MPSNLAADAASRSGVARVVSSIILTASDRAGGRIEVDEPLRDLLGLVVMDPMRGVGQALDPLEVGHIVADGLGQLGAEVPIALAPDDQCGRRDWANLGCGGL